MVNQAVEAVSGRIGVSGRAATVAGLQVQTSEQGVGATPIVILHHSTGPLWTPFYDQLSAANRVVAPDLSGYGRSDRPEFARSPRDLAILCQRALDELEPETFHLVGLGLGGWVAAEMATMSPRRLASLTLVGAAGIKPRTGFIHDPMMAGYIEYAELGFHDEARYDQVFGSDPPEDLIALWDHSREMTARVTWKPWMWSLQLSELVRDLPTPALVVWGRHDLIVPIDCGEQYSELLAHACFEIVESAGHLVDLEFPELLTELVTDFVSSVER